MCCEWGYILKAVQVAGRVKFGVRRVQWLWMDSDRNRDATHSAKQAAGHSSPNTTANSPLTLILCRAVPLQPLRKKKYTEREKGERVTSAIVQKKKSLFRSHFILFNGKEKALRLCDLWLVLQRFFQEPLIVKRVNHRVQTHPEGFRRRPTDDCFWFLSLIGLLILSILCLAHFRKPFMSLRSQSTPHGQKQILSWILHKHVFFNVFVWT